MQKYVFLFKEVVQILISDSFNSRSHFYYSGKPGFPAFKDVQSICQVIISKDSALLTDYFKKSDILAQ